MNKKIKLLTLSTLLTVLVSSTTTFAVNNTGVDATSKLSTVQVMAVSNYPYAISAIIYSNGNMYITSSIDNDFCSFPITCLVGYNHYYRGATVKGLQLLLNSNDYYLSVDGQFGPATHSALLDFQSRHGLSCDGICGPSTWKALVRYMKTNALPY